MKFKIQTLLLFVMAFQCGAYDKNPMQKDWDLINYDKDMQQRGDGITVGVIDTSFDRWHPSLYGQMIDWYGIYNDNVDTGKVFSSTQHGTMVTGIILGNDYDNKNNPHGIAPGAKYYGVTYMHPNSSQGDPYFNTEGNIYNYLGSKGIKVINNSWSGSYYPNINKQIANRAPSWFNFTYKDLEPGTNTQTSTEFIFGKDENGNDRVDYFLKDLMRLSKEKGVLQVFATGNEGLQAPSMEASMPTYDQELRGWLSVGSVNSSYIKKDENGKLIFEKQKLAEKLQNGQWKMSEANMYAFEGGISAFSNSFKGSESYGIVSPGEYITSANSYYLDKTHSDNSKLVHTTEFIIESGTSFSAPFVSGAAALVQEKFSFLDGAQLADVLLSTANSNVELPEMVIKVSSFQGSPSQNNNDLFYYYDVIYTNEKYAPKDLTNKDQIKRDLQEKLGYKEEIADMIVKHLMNSDQKGNGGSASIMTKEQLIGQGVLDIEKALNGLAKLDANRLLDSNVRGDQAFYVIDTKGYDGEFVNNIEQVLWNKDWHNPNALNAPKLLADIQKIGFEKIGEGRLIFSGTNSYYGDTIVSSGVLELSKNGKLTQSNATAKDSGILLLKDGGEIYNNATAKDGGILLLKGGKIDNVTTAQNGGFVAFSGIGNKANRVVSLQGGSIDFLRGSELTTTSGVENNGILRGVGVIDGDLENKGLVMAGFYDIYTPFNKDDTLEIKGKFTQKTEDAKLQLAFTKQDSQFMNTGFKSQSYDISGGALQYVPMHDVEKLRLIKPGETLNLNLDNSLEAQLNNFTNISAKGTNVLDFDVINDGKSILAKNKVGAFRPTNGGGEKVALALQEMFNRDISKDYKEAFANLDAMSHERYQEAVDSIHDTPTDSVVSAIDSVERTISVRNTLYLINPGTLVFNKTASLGGDYLYNIYKPDIDGAQVSMGVTYRRTKHSDFLQNAYLVDVQVKKPLSESTNFGAFVGFSDDTTQKSNSDINSNIFSAGLGLSHNFGVVGILGNIGGGLGTNALKQSVANIAGSTSKANYNSYFIHAQTGLFFPIKFPANLRLSPIAMIDYTHIFQDKFKQQGGIFGREFEAGNIGFSRGWLGANLSHTAHFSDTRFQLMTSVFGFYWHKFAAKQHQQLRFIDAPDLHIVSENNIDRNGTYLGADIAFSYNRMFVNMRFASEVASLYNQLEIMIRLGLSF